LKKSANWLKYPEIMTNPIQTLRKSVIVGLSAISFSAIGSSAQAAILQNGGFVPTGLSVSARLNSSVTLPGWDYTGNYYNFLVPDGTAFATNLEALGNSDEGALSLYSAQNQTVTAPGGSGWFIAGDGVYTSGPISQTLTGLTAGQQYNVTFSQAAGQQTGYSGKTTEWWNVSFGGVQKSSTVIKLPSQAAVTPWQQETLTFTASSSTQVLSFLAGGSPTGKPPFSLLAGVSVDPVAVPEPFTLVGTIVGLGLGARLRSKLNQKQ
jgi:hypothetical protein